MSRLSNKPIDALARFVAAQADLRLGIVFGSVAHGRARPDSDVDIAVYGERALTAERKMQLIEELARITGRPVDLVDLATAGLPVVRSALLDGDVVFSRDQDIYPTLVTRMLIDSADFLPYRNRILRERRERWIH